MLIQRNIAVPKKSKKSVGKHRCDFLAYFHISYFSEDLWVTYVESSFSGLGEIKISLLNFYVYLVHESYNYTKIK